MPNSRLVGPFTILGMFPLPVNLRNMPSPGPSRLQEGRSKRKGGPFEPSFRVPYAASFFREAFLRSFGSRIALRMRMDLGVTSTISSSSI